IDTVKIIAEYRVDTTASLASLAAQATVTGIDCPAVAQVNSAEPLSDTIVTFDVTACRTWTRDDLLDANFQVRIGARRGNNATPVNFFLDNVRVKVTYNTTGYKASSEIETQWNKTNGHRQKGLTCLGNGNPNTGCHLNGHGSGNIGILASNMTLPLPDRFEENDFQLCFVCHASYATTVSKEIVFGVQMGGNYDNAYGPFRSAGPATLTFNDAANTITRDTGSFIADRFLIGNDVRTDATDIPNQGSFTIAAVTSSTLTVTTLAGGDPALVDTTEANLTVDTQSPFYYIPAIQTRFRDQCGGNPLDPPYKDDNCFWWGIPKSNLHWFHIGIQAGRYRDAMASGINCTTCHSVHGTDSQWGMTHDELGYQHNIGVGTDEYGTMSSQLPYTADLFPMNCTMACHDGTWWGTTSNWFEPANE
ncbi:MAG TPA: hypothetical protein VN604_09380, partial [Nitrospirota bacterium]|nr:hypothetical protein [Nitrospirota bacterium]